MSSLLADFTDQVRGVIEQLGVQCEVKRFPDEPDQGPANGYGKTPTSPSISGSDWSTVGSVPAVRFWPREDDRTDRQRTQYGYVDSDSPHIAIPIDADVQVDDYLIYEGDVYQLDNPVEYPTHYEFDSVLQTEETND